MFQVGSLRKGAVRPRTLCLWGEQMGTCRGLWGLPPEHDGPSVEATVLGLLMAIATKSANRSLEWEDSSSTHPLGVAEGRGTPSVCQKK